MADDLKSNLEPIEDADLNLKNKFLGDAEKKAGGAEKKETGKKVESLVFGEKAPERKEGAVEKEAAYSKILSKVKTPTAPADDTIASDAKSTSAERSAEAKIERLVQLATQKGVIHAVKVARHLDDNYTMDEFHDRLMAEELHDALVKKGLIKEI
ncbi:MAG: hypothetical protein WC608_02755 [Parcubacteria group bacterium]